MNANLEPDQVLDGPPPDGYEPTASLAWIEIAETDDFGRLVNALHQKWVNPNDLEKFCWAMVPYYR